LIGTIIEIEIFYNVFSLFAEDWLFDVFSLCLLKHYDLKVYNFVFCA
jgi:hypothetical protein